MSNIHVSYKQHFSDQSFDIDVTIPGNGITSVFGKSGAGKTSLINIIAGLNTPTEGKVTVSGKTFYCSETKVNIPMHKRRVGYVFQEARLFPHYRVKGNLLYGVIHPDKHHFDKIVQLLDLHSLLSRYPNQLSGGEKQRVAIGRALLSKPSVLLMDEPLASLDIPLKKELLPYLEHLAHEIKLPIIYVTHSLYEIVRLANHIIVIDNGTAIASDTLEKVWATSVLAPWRQSRDQSSLFEATLVNHNTNYALSQVQLANDVYLWVQKLEMNISSNLRVQVRASDVSIALTKPDQTSIRNILTAKIVEINTPVDNVEHKHVSVKLELEGQCFLWASITTWAMDELALEVGLQVFAQIKGVSVTQKDIVLHP